MTGQVSTPGTGFRVPLNGELGGRLAGWVGRHVVLGIRPEHFHLHQTASHSVPVPVKVNVVEPLGNDMDAYIDTALHVHKICRVEADPSLKAGSATTLYIDPSRVHIFEPGVLGRNLALTQSAMGKVA
ncbi:MAG: TOBE domain-containing protein [Phycisphaerae bacterium]|nr:TOBE domain-containing protein [Phycisphaerae bacterium]